MLSKLTFGCKYECYDEFLRHFREIDPTRVDITFISGGVRWGDLKPDLCADRRFMLRKLNVRALGGPNRAFPVKDHVGSNWRILQNIICLTIVFNALVRHHGLNTVLLHSASSEWKYLRCGGDCEDCSSAGWFLEELRTHHFKLEEQWKDGSWSWDSRGSRHSRDRAGSSDDDGSRRPRSDAKLRGSQWEEWERRLNQTAREGDPCGWMQGWERGDPGRHENKSVALRKGVAEKEAAVHRMSAAWREGLNVDGRKFC